MITSVIQTQRDQINALQSAKAKTKKTLATLERKITDQSEEIELLSRALEIKAEDLSILSNRDVDKSEIIQAASASRVESNI